MLVEYFVDRCMQQELGIEEVNAPKYGLPIHDVQFMLPVSVFSEMLVVAVFRPLEVVTEFIRGR